MATRSVRTAATSERAPTLLMLPSLCQAGMQMQPHMQVPWCCRTRRVWKPNVQTVSLWSDALHRTIQLRATTHALRSECG